MHGSLTKEFPLHEKIDATIALIQPDMTYKQLRQLASANTSIDIPAILANRFLLVQNGTIIQDRFLNLVAERGVSAPIVRKVMYFTWAMRDDRLRRFILERIAADTGLWRPEEVTRKANASFFQEFYTTNAAPKVRSNIEFFLVEAGILNGGVVHLELDDGWLTEGIRTAAQHVDESNGAEMLSDPIGYIIRNRLVGLTNATLATIHALATTTEVPPVTHPSGGSVGGDGKSGGVPGGHTGGGYGSGSLWIEHPFTIPVEKTITVEISNVTRERANNSHKVLENNFAAAATRKGYSPKKNRQIDMFFTAGAETVLAEMKSCNKGNYRAQLRKGVGQILEYEYIYGKTIGGNVLRILVLQFRPVSADEWLIGYLTRLHILMVWFNDASNRFETTQTVPNVLQDIVYQV